MTDEVTEFPTKLNALPSETRQEAREKWKARKAFAAVSSAFVRALVECMRAYREARAQGVERADAARGIEEVLRGVWPKPATKFPPKCEVCEDVGYEEFLCRQWARCERESCQRKGEDWQHLYVRPCECAKGQQFRPKVYQPQQAAESLGKVSKAKRGFNRLGA